MDKPRPKSLRFIQVMKNSPIITLLLAAVCVLGFIVLGLALGVEIHYRQLRHLQPQLAESQNTRNLVNLMANDALEYSKTHPAIDAILGPVGVKPTKAALAPTTKPGNK